MRIQAGAGLRSGLNEGFGRGGGLQLECYLVLCWLTVSDRHYRFQTFTIVATIATSTIIIHAINNTLISQYSF